MVPGLGLSFEGQGGFLRSSCRATRFRPCGDRALDTERQLGYKALCMEKHLGDFDPRRDLETIRTLMERARHYRHPPAPAAFVCGALALGAGLWTERALAASALPVNLVPLGLAWGAVFLVSLVLVVSLTWLACRREGVEFISPLAVDVLHALWPPLVAALALTWSLASVDHAELVPALWMLCYGAGGVAAGSFARTDVRWLGIAFVAAGLAKLFVPGLGHGHALAATFGGFHLAYGLAVLRRAEG
jgi:hypothetical protein